MMKYGHFFCPLHVVILDPYVLASYYYMLNGKIVLKLSEVHK
jgi:hypothetical protein